MTPSFLVFRSPEQHHFCNSFQSFQSIKPTAFTFRETESPLCPLLVLGVTIPSRAESLVLAESLSTCLYVRCNSGIQRRLPIEWALQSSHFHAKAQRG